MNNLHISLTEFRNESRLLKQANSLLNNNIFDNVYIAALHSDGLKELESSNERLLLRRFKLKSRPFGSNIFVQLIKYFEFCLRVFRHYKKKNISVLNVHSLGLLPLGVVLKYFFKAKLIYDAHELETERNGLVGFRKKLSKVLERRLIGHVDGMFVVSESIADWYRDFYDMRRPTVVMNAPVYIELDKHDKFREELGIAKEKLIFLYQGALSHGRGIHLILDAFLTIEQDSVVAVFMGYGALQKDIVAASKVQNNIFLYPAVPPDDVLAYTSSADVGFSLAENRCLSYEYSMPNKMFEYTMVGLPTIASNMKDIAGFISRFNTGVVIKEDSVECLQSAVLKIYGEGTDKLTKNCRGASKEYCWDMQEKKLLQTYNELLVEG